MQRDATTVPSGATLRFDVCVVGGGPAGLSVAEKLAAKGWTIGLLESGGVRPERGAQKLASGVNHGLPYFRLDRAGGRALGGSSWLWLGQSPYWSLDGGLRSRPLDRLDFEARPDIALSGWPISYDELEPWMRAAFEGADLDFDSFADPGAAGLLADSSVVQTCVSQFAPPDVFRARIPGLAARANVDILTHATVVQIQSQGGGEAVRRLTVASGRGNWFAVEALAFVLAGGGIENARLLLASPLGRAGAQANPFDQVGRNFMEHLHVQSGYFVPAERRDAQQLLSPFRRHDAAGRAQIDTLRIADSVQRQEGLLNTVIEFYPRPRLFTSPGVRSLAELWWGARHRSAPEHVAHHLLNVAGDPTHVTKALFRSVRGKHRLTPEGATLVMTAEQSPNPASRITLASKRDRFGVPLARLEWNLTQLDYRSIRRTQELLDEEFRKAGVGCVEDLWGQSSPTPRVHGCWHHIGTTRMASDPRCGVVDSNCRVHGLRNLWLAGSSVMPTAGAVSVTLSAVGLAIRLADHLDRELA